VVKLKFVQQFSREVANRQTGRTDRQTDKRQALHNFLFGGKNIRHAPRKKMLMMLSRPHTQAHRWV